MGGGVLQPPTPIQLMEPPKSPLQISTMNQKDEVENEEEEKKKREGGRRER